MEGLITPSGFGKIVSRPEMARRVAKDTGLKKGDVHKTILAYEAELRNILLNGGGYKIYNVGEIRVVKAKARVIKNDEFRGGNTNVPERYRISFASSKTTNAELRKYNITKKEEEGEDEFAIFE